MDKKSLIADRFQPIELLLLDVDGVLTEGAIAYTEDQTETKVFHVKDGLGIKMLHQSGIMTGIVTGRASPALLRRCRELGIHMVYDNIQDKGAVFDRITEATGLPASSIAFMGDDLPDLPMFKKAGLSIAVADAHSVVREQADMITEKCGGQGAVREVCEMIIKSKGLWDALIEQWK
ncbi:MAG TPA: HAD hydrolase family protein [Desulfosalsimonadaceae bacterium]|nr:HAD hydrolase family protein [Desulfosalsimonadaceae bacterium]